MRGLNKLYYIKLEKEKLKEEIQNLQDEINSIPEISGQNLTGMPHSSGVSSPIENYLEQKDRLVERLNKKIKGYMEKIEQYEAELIRIETIIDQIDNIEIKSIARMRLILNMKWEDIGEEVHLDRSVCSKKLRNYLKRMDIQM